MKSFYKFLLALIVTFALLNILYVLILTRIDWDFSKTKEAYDFKNRNFKILVLGNSTALDGVNTGMLSQAIGKAYNFSITGESLESNYIQLKSYLENNTKPERVFLCLSSTHLEYNKMTSETVNPIVEYYYADGNDYYKTLTDIPLFKFRWLFIENVKKLISADHRAAKIINGQLQIKRSIADETKRNTFPDTCFGNTHYNGNGYESMWKMIDLCNQNGIKISVFEMPCWSVSRTSCSEIPVTKTLSALTDTVKIVNFNYYKLCDSMFDPNRDWLSNDHLNYYGSQKLTNEIIHYLLSH